MRIVAVEEHFMPKDVAAAVGIHPAAALLNKSDEVDDLGEARLRAMDAAGIDVQVLSAVSYAVQGLDPDRSLAVSKDLNDRMATAVAAYPDRFRAFATLPMSDPHLAFDELTRAVNDLGCVGAMIFGQTKGVFLDHPSVRVVGHMGENLPFSLASARSGSIDSRRRSWERHNGGGRLQGWLGRAELRYRRLRGSKPHIASI